MSAFGPSLEPPDLHDCPDEDEGRECRCEERDEERREDAMVERAEARAESDRLGRDEDWYEG